jgi:hypothetical protein
MACPRGIKTKTLSNGFVLNKTLGLRIVVSAFAEPIRKSVRNLSNGPQWVLKLKFVNSLMNECGECA